MRDERRNLWRDTAFLKLLLNETISVFGSPTTPLPLPLTAVLVLDTSLAQIGALTGSSGLRPTLPVATLAGTLAPSWVVALPCSAPAATSPAIAEAA